MNLITVWDQAFASPRTLAFEISVRLIRGLSNLLSTGLVTLSSMPFATTATRYTSITTLTIFAAALGTFQFLASHLRPVDFNGKPRDLLFEEIQVTILFLFPELERTLHTYLELRRLNLGNQHLDETLGTLFVAENLGHVFSIQRKHNVRYKT